MANKITLLAKSIVNNQFDVTLENVKGCVTGTLSWRVTYGAESNVWHTLSDAVNDYNASVQHQLNCASLYE